MTTPLQWALDLTDALDCRDVITEALAHGRCLRDRRGQLRRAADSLDQVVRHFALEMSMDDYEEQYLCLFDALGYLNASLRFSIINRRQLNLALVELHKLDTFGTDGGDQL